MNLELSAAQMAHDRSDGQFKIRGVTPAVPFSPQLAPPPAMSAGVPPIRFAPDAGAVHEGSGLSEFSFARPAAHSSSLRAKVNCEDLTPAVRGEVKN